MSYLYQLVVVELCSSLQPGAQEPPLHAGAEEPLLPHGGVQEEVRGSITRCGDPQRCLQVQRVTAGNSPSAIACLI